MNTRLMHEGQQSLGRRDAGLWRLHEGSAATLRPALAGDLTVRTGRVWITHDAEPGDWVLTAGQSLRLRRGQAVVVETWDVHEFATLDWTPVPGLAQRARLGWAWRVLADGADALARGLAGLADWARARSAAPSASRAQGSMKSGASMASCGGA